MRDLKGKVVIVTGGARGIGAACSRAFAEEGAKVVFTYNKSKKNAEALREELKKKVDVLAVQADAKEYGECRGVVDAVLKKFNAADVLVNNAGIIKDKALMMMTGEDWREVIDTNLGGVFNMTKAVITTFLKQKAGCIINMSSVSGLIGAARQTNYAASKAGIIGFSKSLAKEVAPYNIRVNAVCPGYIETEMLSSLRPEIKKEILNLIPVKRLGEPREVASLCVFLASEKARYITGEAIKIDGGLAI